MIVVDIAFVPDIQSALSLISGVYFTKHEIALTI